MAQILGKTLFIGLSLLLLLSSCEFKDIELKEVQNVEVASINKNEIEGVVSVVLNNPNGFSVTIKEADFIILAGDVEIGSAQLNESFKIAANSEESYPIKLRGDASKALSGGISAVVGMLFGKEPKILLKGDIKARSFIFTKTVPVELETDIKLSDLNL